MKREYNQEATARRLRELRVSNQVKQQDIANHFKQTRSMISGLEKKTSLSMNALLNFVSFYEEKCNIKVSLDWLVYGEEPKKDSEELDKVKSELLELQRKYIKQLEK